MKSLNLFDSQQHIESNGFLDLHFKVKLPKQSEVQAEKIPPLEEGERLHAKFEDARKCITSGLNVLLVGGAGSGKTHLAEQVARAMSLPFYPQSVGQQTTKSDLIGYMDAYGKYVSTPLRKAFESGGVYLLDELDCGNPGVLTVLNAALANDYMSFPDQVIHRYPDFHCIAAANTFGRGADRKYVGRNKLDAATLNRFITIEIEYDEAFELALVEAKRKRTAKSLQAMRTRSTACALEVIISTRNILQVCKLMEAGYNFEVACSMSIFSGIPEEQIAKVQAGRGRDE